MRVNYRKEPSDKLKRMRSTKKAGDEGKKRAEESQQSLPKTRRKLKKARSTVGKALEATMLTETGRKVARRLGGNPEPAKKKRSSGFGGPMSIPPAGGKTERVHGSGYDKLTHPKKKK